MIIHSMPAAHLHVLFPLLAPWASQLVLVHVIRRFSGRRTAHAGVSRLGRGLAPRIAVPGILLSGDGAGTRLFSQRSVTHSRYATLHIPLEGHQTCICLRRPDKNRALHGARLLLTPPRLPDEMSHRPISSRRQGCGSSRTLLCARAPSLATRAVSTPCPQPPPEGWLQLFSWPR